MGGGASVAELSGKELVTKLAHAPMKNSAPRPKQYSTRERIVQNGAPGAGHSRLLASTPIGWRESNLPEQRRGTDELHRDLVFPSIAAPECTPRERGSSPELR